MRPVPTEIPYTIDARSVFPGYPTHLSVLALAVLVHLSVLALKCSDLFLSFNKLAYRVTDLLAIAFFIVRRLLLSSASQLPSAHPVSDCTLLLLESPLLSLYPRTSLSPASSQGTLLVSGLSTPLQHKYTDRKSRHQEAGEMAQPHKQRTTVLVVRVTSFNTTLSGPICL